MKYLYVVATAVLLLAVAPSRAQTQPPISPQGGSGSSGVSEYNQGRGGHGNYDRGWQGDREHGSYRDDGRRGHRRGGLWLLPPEWRWVLRWRWVWRSHDRHWRWDREPDWRWERNPDGHGDRGHH